MKGKRQPKLASSGGAAPSGQASSARRLKTRPAWLSRWLHASRQEAGVLFEENHGPESK